MDPSWSMFEKIKELGVGSFGTVYLVKCMQNSLIRTDAENPLNTTQSAVKPGGGNTKKVTSSFLGGSVPGVTTRAMTKN